MSKLTIRNYDGTAWSKLGKTRSTHATWKEVEADAQLDFAVFKSQLRDGRGKPVDAYGTFRWNKADIANNNPDGAIFLGTVGKDYQIVPHAVGFNIVDQLIGEQTSGAHYVTAGTLDGGAVVWGMADLGLTTRVGDDEHKNYLLHATSHDGRTSWIIKGVNTRVICGNTFYYALGEKTTSVFSVRHTKSALDRIEGVREALASYTNDVRTAEQKLRWLASRKLDKTTTLAVLDRLFPPTKKEVVQPEGLVKVDFSSKARLATLDAVLSRFEANDGNAFPEQAGSAYALFNAVTNFADHARGKDENRAESALFGSGEKLKQLAWDTILEQSKQLPALVTVR